MTYRFVFISKRKFFGAKQISIDGSQVNISEPEKTIVDCLDRVRYTRRHIRSGEGALVWA